MAFVVSVLVLVLTSVGVYSSFIIDEIRLSFFAKLVTGILTDRLRGFCSVSKSHSILLFSLLLLSSGTTLRFLKNQKQEALLP